MVTSLYIAHVSSLEKRLQVVTLGTCTSVSIPRRPEQLGHPQVKQNTSHYSTLQITVDSHFERSFEYAHSEAEKHPTILRHRVMQARLERYLYPDQPDGLIPCPAPDASVKPYSKLGSPSHLRTALRLSANNTRKNRLADIKLVYM